MNEKYKDYIPLPDNRTTANQEKHTEIVDWVRANARRPKWSWTRRYQRWHPRIRLGVWLSPEDAIILKLKFNIGD